jgi:hypothetical protein
MLTWQQRRELLDEAARRSPRREREVLRNLVEEARLGARVKPMSASASRHFNRGVSQQKREAP